MEIYRLNDPPLLAAGIAGVIGVLAGFCLGFSCDRFIRGVKQKKANAKLMRQLLEEIATNRLKCRTVFKHGIINGFFETYAWDKVRNNALLSSDISVRNRDMYESLYTVYAFIGDLNNSIGHYLRQMDYGNIGSIKDEHGSALQKDVKNFSPRLESLETEVKEFLS